MWVSQPKNMSQTLCTNLCGEIRCSKPFETTPVGFLKNLSDSGCAATEISYAEPLVSFMGHPHHS